MSAVPSTSKKLPSPPVPSSLPRRTGCPKWLTKLTGGIEEGPSGCQYQRLVVIGAFIDRLGLQEETEGDFQRLRVRPAPEQVEHRLEERSVHRAGGVVQRQGLQPVGEQSDFVDPLPEREEGQPLLEVFTREKESRVGVLTRLRPKSCLEADPLAVDDGSVPDLGEGGGFLTDDCG